LFFAAAPAAATPPTETGESTDITKVESADSHRAVAVTLSAVQLLFPIVEVTAEVAIGSRLSLSLVAGAGQLTVSTLEDRVEQERKIDVWELGGQACAYPLGDFDHGMQLGLEVMYYDLSLPPGAEVTGTGEGLAVGPFAGYKYSAPFGLTVNAQLGLQIMSGESDGDMIAKKQLIPFPLVNLNLGWAF
jgi:hypothetical protein